MINTDKVLKFNNSFTLLWSERAINVQCNYYWIKTPSVSIINANNCTESVSSMRECTWTSKRQVSSLRPHTHCFQIYLRWMHIVPKTRYRIKTAVYLWSATWISLRSFARPRSGIQWRNEFQLEWSIKNKIFKIYLLLITDHKRSCGKLMFSQTSICSWLGWGGGGGVTPNASLDKSHSRCTVLEDIRPGDLPPSPRHQTWGPTY